ncbi:hypothetical protein AB9M62_48620 [Bacillales bacterium AN1005]
MYNSQEPNHMCSEDYNELIDMALAQWDKEWFVDLVQRQKQLRTMEIEIRHWLGVVG